MNIYLTQWTAVDPNKEYPHGWGFQPPLVEFPSDADTVWCVKTCMEVLSNEEFRCIGATPQQVLTNIHCNYPKEKL
jgi:hypothetical protein